MISITLLGSTGSIGINTLDIIARHPDRFRVLALSANTQVARLFQQCIDHRPRYAVLRDPTAALQLEQKLKQAGYTEIEVLSGDEGLVKIATLPEVDRVLAGIVGAAGLLPTFAAAKAGKYVLLANKEALVMTGHLFMQTAAQHQATVIPVDSEHSAIFQSLPTDYRIGNPVPFLHRIILTASGGAFRDWPVERLAEVTPEQACQHPNWKMGPKITVDCASMMNKGLEVIEAYWLFALQFHQIEVMLHPQSTIHSLVEFCDGSNIAQLGCPDMRIPISYSLAWPERITSGANYLDLLALSRLDFLPLSLTRYPCLRLAYEALQAGGTAPAILNAANEIAVAAFLNRQIRFTDIPHLIEAVLTDATITEVTSLETAIKADHYARHQANEWLLQKSSPLRGALFTTKQSV